MLDIDSSKWIDVTDYLDVVRDRNIDNQFEKISLEFTAPMTTDYRLTYIIDRPLKDFVNRSDQYEYQLTFSVGNNKEYITFFDFSDIASLPDVILSHGVDNINGNDKFWFSVQRDNILQGTNVVLDPIFGNQNRELNKYDTDDCPGGYFQMGSTEGTADNISVYLDYVTPGGVAKCAIYNSSGNLLTDGITNEVSVNADGLYIFSFSTSPTLIANAW